VGIAGQGGLLDPVMTFLPPTAEQQIAFLHDLQRIFEEGDFSATYKFALLMALAEIAVEAGSDSGAPATVRLHLIGEKFVELYWRQAAPYSTVEGTAGVLWQNRGVQAAVIRHLDGLHALSRGNISAARRSDQWLPAIRAVAGIIRLMPLQHLQVIAGEQRPFLYDYPPVKGDEVELKSGVVYNLRRFQGFIQQMARSAWVDHVRSNARNAPILGKTDDLEGFMFGTPRADLSAVADLLVGLQSRRCFYCDSALPADAGVVDHFIPWSRYPRDTAHNFVLAHAGCNGDKRALLAAKGHLERWAARNDQYRDDIGGALSREGFIDDIDASKMIARWAYQQSIGGHAWVSKGQREPIDATYLEAV
jgi:5-methylcytosine-specific restriction endonuclease McrA